jgi:hypothetical protein
VEDALRIKSEVIPSRCNGLFNFIVRAKIAILQDSFQQLPELMYDEYMGREIVKGVASRILTPLLIHCGASNYPYTPQKSIVASDDGNAEMPFPNPENCN